VVVATPDGGLCVLSPEDGARRGQLGVGGVAGAVDVLASRSGAGRLVTIEPGEQEPGQIVQYRLAGDALQPEDVRPFDALDGRLLWAGDLIAGAAISEGATLFAESGATGGGGAWSMISSMAAFSRSDGALRVVTVGPGATGIERREAVLSAAGLAPLPADRRAVAGACAAVFDDHGGPGLASSDGHSIQIERSSGEIEAHEAPGACVEAALGVEDGLLLLTGPVPTLRWLDGEISASIVLGDPSPGAAWLPRRLAHDAGRQRAWVIVGSHLLAVDREAGGLHLTVAEAGCPAASVTLVDGG
jgi:hypothetical protein